MFSLQVRVRDPRSVGARESVERIFRRKFDEILPEFHRNVQEMTNCLDILRKFKKHILKIRSKLKLKLNQNTLKILFLALFLKISRQFVIS